MMNPLASTLMSVAMLGAFALMLLGARLAWKGTNRRHGLMMMLVGVILIANVLVWTV
jgi:hypothetical protein